MCIFCVGDDVPFHLRKSTAFPRKMIAEAVQAEAEPCETAKSAARAVEPQQDGAVQQELPPFGAFRRPAGS